MTATANSNRHTIQVEDHSIVISNLDKVLYPESGFTKGQLLDYYARVAPVLLPHLRGRPLTRKRYPNGVDGASFFEKNAPRGTPTWVRTATLPVPGSTKDRETIDYVIADDLATLMWLANLAALELHVPQWRVGPDGAVLDVDLLVFDLDPGEPASIVECCQVALLIKEILDDAGLPCYPKTSGSKGLQLYVPLPLTPAEHTRAYAKSTAKEVTRQRPELVLSEMTRALRPGKVLIDWSQNNAAKTTIAPYSLRARPTPTVSTPITWDEVAQCRRPEELRFEAGQVLDRVARDGDLLADLVDLPAAERSKLPEVEEPRVTRRATKKP